MEHHFRAHAVWSGASAGPVTDYRSYSREFTFAVQGKALITGSAAGPFLGDESLINPEELLLMAVSSCHMLSYLAVCARRGISVIAYEDECTATMAMKDGKMRITEATLRPKVTVPAGTDLEKALLYQHRASEECFIASSVNFPIAHEASFELFTAGD